MVSPTTALHPTRLNRDEEQTFKERLIRALKDRRVLRSLSLELAFEKVRRTRFVDEVYIREPGALRWTRRGPADFERPDQWLELIYADEALVTALDEDGLPTSASTAPWLMALMLEALELFPGAHVLEIGTGSGYNTAILAAIVKNPRLLVSIELDEHRARAAGQWLEVTDAGIEIVNGNGLDGYPQRAPYDRIIATASYSSIP